jgi:hypothetical protein
MISMIILFENGWLVAGKDSGDSLWKQAPFLVFEKLFFRVADEWLAMSPKLLVCHVARILSIFLMTLTGIMCVGNLFHVISHRLSKKMAMTEALTCIIDTSKQYDRPVKLVCFQYAWKVYFEIGSTHS